MGVYGTCFFFLMSGSAASLLGTAMSLFSCLTCTCIHFQSPDCALLETLSVPQISGILLKVSRALMIGRLRFHYPTVSNLAVADTLAIRSSVPLFWCNVKELMLSGQVARIRVTDSFRAHVAGASPLATL
jgi:hypothetical protein